MANAVLRRYTKNVVPGLTIHVEQVRYGHHIRGKPPTIARTLEQRLNALKQEQTNPMTSCKVNIGFSVPRVSLERKSMWMSEIRANRSNSKLMKQIKRGELAVDLNSVKQTWQETLYSYHIHKIANHYGIFQDLFGDAFFMPVVPLHITYEAKPDAFVNVYTGNVIKPVEASKSPLVEYQADPDTLWTLIMSTPDGNMEDASFEYCHWFLGNIPGNKIEKGEEIVDYLRPITPRGVGYYRYVFILYKQDRHMDYTLYKKAPPCLELNNRNWKTLEFYRKHEKYLTPASLVFFQSDWDPTVREFYHSKLATEEPVFQYNFPKPYIKPQTWFPIKESFNLYMDRYRDPKEVAKEYLLKKLKTVHPFKDAKPPLKYPNAVSYEKNTPSWLKVELRKERLGYGRINEMK